MPVLRAVAKRARTVGGPREFHAAICGSCGGQAMVPFAPRNDRPGLLQLVLRQGPGRDDAPETVR